MSEDQALTHGSRSTRASPAGRHSVADAVTALFVPGDRPDRFAKAATAGADLVIIDLEDAVPTDRRDEATRTAVAALDAGMQAVVRVVAATDVAYRRQLDQLSRTTPLAIMLAKAERADDVADADVLLGGGTPLIPLVESAAGIANAGSLASAPRVARLAFGAFDFVLDVDGDAPALLDYARSALVVASRVAQVAAPLASPPGEIRELDLVRAEARASRAAGFGGMLTIHPAQVPVVNAAFSPTQAEADEARRILGALEGVSAVDGRMVDRPIIERAKRTLSRWGRLSGTPPERP